MKKKHTKHCKNNEKTPQHNVGMKNTTQCWNEKHNTI